MSTPTRNRRPRAWGAVAAVLGLLLTACGSDAEPGSVPTSAAPSSAAAPTSATASSAATSAASSDASTSESSSAAAPADLGLMTDGTLVVGMNLQFPPQMFLDDSGQPAGYDVDLLNALADELGVELDIQNLDFNGLIPGLQSKKFDLVSVGLNATEERKKVIDFSRGYMPYTSVLAVAQDDTSAPTVESYNTSGTVITALQGSTAETLAKQTFPSATVTGFPDQNAALLEVATGRAQGTVLEDYILARFDKANPGRLKAAEFPEPLQISYGSWAVQKGNTGLVTALDSFLCTAQNDGKLAELYEKNFGVAELPPMPEGC